MEGNRDTLGAYTFSETIVPPQTGPDPHRHPREDEAFWIPHAFKNVGSSPARMIGVISPAGLETFFDERDALMKTTAPTDPSYPAKYKALTDKYGLEYSRDWNFPPK